MKNRIDISRLKTGLMLGSFALLATLGGAIAIANHQTNAAGETCTAKSGTFDDVDYQITNDCQLIIGKSGEIQTMTYRASRNRDSYPWNGDRANIKTTTFAGSVVGQGSLQRMFYVMSNLTTIENISNLDTTNATSMMSMFEGASSLVELDLSTFDTTNVTDMRYMFYNASSLKVLDVSNFNTSNITDMTSVFRGVSSLVSLDLSSFDTSNVTAMINMFYDASSLSSLNLSNWNTSSVTSMQNMFYNTTSLNTVTFSDTWTKWTTGANLLASPTTGQWIKSDNSLPAKTPDELRTELPNNLSTYAGTWVWEVEYTVNHWQQKVGGNASIHDANNYDLIETETLTAPMGYTVSPVVKSYSGFVSPSLQSITLPDNNSAVVDYYYAIETKNPVTPSNPVVPSVSGEIAVPSTGKNKNFELTIASLMAAASLGLSLVGRRIVRNR